MPYSLSDDSAAAYSRNTTQNPSAELPQSSVASPSCWLEKAVREVYRTSNDLNTVKDALRLLPIPDDVVALLSKREKIWLDSLLEAICKENAIKVGHFFSSDFTAQEIVNIVTRRRLSLPYSGSWIVSSLMGETTIPTIAEELTSHIQSLFSRTIIRDWVAVYSGYRIEFLDNIVKVRDRLFSYAQKHGTVKLTSVLEALPSQQPLARWILSTAISYDASSNPITPLRFIIDPIKQLLTEHQHEFSELIQHLAIIEARFKVLISDMVNWPAPFSTDFSLWQSISSQSPEKLADSITKDVEKLFDGLNYWPKLFYKRDAWPQLFRGPNTWPLLFHELNACPKPIFQNWIDFTEDILACLKVATWVTTYVKELINLFLSSHPRNIYSATAAASALYRSGFRPRMAWAAWDIIKPHGDFTRCRQLMNEGNCLRYVVPSMTTDQPYGTLESSRENFETMRGGKNIGRGILGGRQEVENRVQKRTYNEYSPNYPEHLPTSSFVTGKHPVHDSTPIDNEQPNAKRAALGFGCHPSFNRNQQYQDSMFHDPVTSSGNDANYFALNHGRASGIDETQRDLHTNFDGRNSTALFRDDHQAGIWQAQPSGGEGNLKRADSRYMTPLDTTHRPGIQSPHLPPLSPAIHSQASSSTVAERNSADNKRRKLKSSSSCTTCWRRRILCDEGKPICAECLDLGSKCIFPDSMINNIYYKWPSTPLNSEISHDLRITLPPISSLLGIGSEGSKSEIHSEMLRLKDQTERDLDHTKRPPPSSPAIALQKSENQTRLGAMGLMNQEIPHQAPLERTTSRNDTDAQRVNFAELSEGQYSMTVAQVSTPPSASIPALGHVEGSRYLKNAPTLQGDSTVPFESPEKMNQNPAQHENPAELLVTPKPSPEKKGAVEMSWKHTGNADENSFSTHSISSFPSRTGTSVSPDLTKDVRMQPRKLAPKNPLKQDFIASREGSNSEANHLVPYPQCFALTDEQCEMIQKTVDPDGTRRQKCWEVNSQLRLIRLYMTGMSFRQMESATEELGWTTYSARFRDWRFPVDTQRADKIKQLYALVSESTSSTGSHPHDRPPEHHILAFNEGLNSQVHSSARLDSIASMATEHAASERQRSTIPSPASQLLTTEAIDEEQSDFARYSHHDLGETFVETRSRFKERFRKSLSDEIFHLKKVEGSTSLIRREIACETKSRLVDAKPYHASKYPWVENFHKQEIEANLGGAMLPSLALEYLRPFSVEALDFLWFLHFDLGIFSSSLLDTFQPRYFKETVSKAHRADFQRRGIALSQGYTDRSHLKTGSIMMFDAYNGRFRLCDLRPDAIQYNWIPDIFKSGMRNPHYRHQALLKFSKLPDKQKIEVMKVQLGGALTFPGLKDMPESTFHRQYNGKQSHKHVASPKPGKNICTRSCTGCVTCKREGEQCDELQLSSKKGIVKESWAPPPSILVDAEQINPKDAFEGGSPTYSPSLLQSFSVYQGYLATTAAGFIDIEGIS